jgi:hypothetical protein
MTTAPIINADRAPTWAGRLTTLLRQCRDISTRLDAKATRREFGGDCRATESFRQTLP